MRFPIVLSAILALAACGSKPKPAAEIGADSAAALPTPSGETTGAIGSATRDSLAPMTDSAASKAASVTPTTSDAKSPASAKAPSKIIGRDSAFGPIGEVDASGKITPIPTKKP